MRLFIFLLTLSICPTVFSQQTSEPIALIPVPVSQTPGNGHFTLPRNILIEARDQQQLVQTLEDLKKHLSIPTGYSVTVTRQPSAQATIRLTLNSTPESTQGIPEGPCGRLHE